MTLAELREKLLKAKTDAAAARAVASKDGATAEQRQAFYDAVKVVTAALEMVKAAEAEELADAHTAAPAAKAGMGHNGGPVFATPKRAVPEESKALMGIAAQHKAAMILFKDKEKVDPYDLLAEEGYTDYVGELKFMAQRQMAAKAAVGGVMSNISGGVLLPTPLTPQILPILTPETTFLQGNPRRIQLTGGVFRQPRGIGSSTAAYVGEGEKKPIGRPTFGDLTMRSHKLAGIVYMTNESVKWTVGALEAYIREDLRRVMGEKMDQAMYLGTGVGSTPLGIFRQPGITTITTFTFADGFAPTYTELDRLATRLQMALTGANLTRNSKWRWVMGTRTKAYLSDMRDGNGNAIYPGVEAGSVWKGIPILSSNSIIENAGVGTNEGSLSLVDFSHVMFAEEEAMVMKSTTEATLDDGGVLVHLWQQNMSAILCEMEHDVGLDQPAAVARIEGLKWGAQA